MANTMAYSRYPAYPVTAPSQSQTLIEYAEENRWTITTVYFDLV